MIKRTSSNVWHDELRQRVCCRAAGGAAVGALARLSHRATAAALLALHSEGHGQQHELDGILSTAAAAPARALRCCGAAGGGGHRPYATEECMVCTDEAAAAAAAAAATQQGPRLAQEVS